ncbi:hypothetical protein [Desulfobacula toluolica]|nr:hypothetical protein [Desulfobacula toluolica]
MKKQIKLYTIILAMVFLGVHGASLAESSENKETFLDVINQIRTAPFSYALSLGYDSEFLVKSGILPETQFEPYAADDFLTAIAADDNGLMTGEETLASKKKPVHLLTAETGGVVSFLNFMSLDTAFKIVIDYLFRKELDTNKFHHILSNAYSYAGIAISPGRVGGLGNAWFVAIRLGSSELVSEMQMLNLINQVRSDPWKILDYSELNSAEVFNENQSVLYLFTNNYQPLFFDASLRAASGAHSFYVFHGAYPEPSGDTPLERAAFHGYEGGFVQESALIVNFLKEEEGGASVDTLFSSLIRNELKIWPLGSAVFLKDFQDAGSSISFGVGADIDVSVLSFVAGKKISDNEQISRIYGVLFSDNDGNGLYSPGEELIQQTVKVYAEEMQAVKNVITDNAGHFSMTLDSNKQYSFKATIEDVPVTQEIFITSDQFVKLVYSPPSL